MTSGVNHLRVGVDVGGTFTDVVAWDDATGVVRSGKVPTVPADRAQGVLDGLRALLGAGGACASLAHGTTTVTNAIVEGHTAPVGLVTTRGFRDVLEIARMNRTHLYRLDLPAKPEPLVPRRRRHEITERVGPDDRAPHRAAVGRSGRGGRPAVPHHAESRRARARRERQGDAHAPPGRRGVDRDVRRWRLRTAADGPDSHRRFPSVKTIEDTKRRLWAEIDRRRDELAQLCADCLKVPAENPPGDTTAIADHYTAILRRAGLAVERFEPKPGIVSLVSTQPGQDRKSVV